MFAAFVHSQVAHFIHDEDSGVRGGQGRAEPPAAEGGRQGIDEFRGGAPSGAADAHPGVHDDHAPSRLEHLDRVEVELA